MQFYTINDIIPLIALHLSVRLIIVQAQRALVGP